MRPTDESNLFLDCRTQKPLPSLWGHPSPSTYLPHVAPIRLSLAILPFLHTSSQAHLVGNSPQREAQLQRLLLLSQFSSDFLPLTSGSGFSWILVSPASGLWGPSSGAAEAAWLCPSVQGPGPRSSCPGQLRPASM